MLTGELIDLVQGFRGCLVIVLGILSLDIALHLAAFYIVVLLNLDGY